MVADTNNTQFSSSNSKNMTYKAVSKYALNGLSDLIRVLMENIDDALFELAEKAQNDNERNLYFEAMREIRIKRSLLQQGFDQAMENCFETVSRSQVHSAATPQETDELSLVELRDIEDSIAIDNMISKARPGFEDELFAVLERLKAVLPQTEIDEDTNPFDPRAICQSFHKASEILDTGIQVKLIFYKLFDKYVISNLGHFYGEMNQFFIDKGILPGLKASDERLKQSTKFMTNRMKKSGRQSTVSALDESMHSTGDATTDGGLLSALQQVMSTDAAAQNPSSAPEAGSGLVSSDGRGANISILPMAQNDAYMSELTNLQMLAPEKQPALNANPDNVHQEMRQKLVAFNQQSDHQTNDADNQIIDIVSMLFDFFLEDPALPDPTKVLIGRLQIPILKAAIIDNNFFNHKKHPARQLLDCMSKISLGWGEDSAMEAKLTGKMESVVNYVLEEFDQDISVFETALENLNQLIATETSNVEIANEMVAQQEQEREQQINVAQQAAVKLITRVCEKRDLSYEVSDFLETTWTSVLFHTHLSQGESSNHWKNLCRTTSTLVWTLLPKFTEAQRAKIMHTLPALLRALSKGMGLVKVGSDTQNRIFRMLAQEHARVVKQTSQNIVTRVDDDTVWPDDNKIADAFAGFNAASKKGVAAKPKAVAPKAKETDPIAFISSEPTQEIILNLDQFTASVKRGDVEIDEEIVLASVDNTTPSNSDNTQDDEFPALAQSLQIGAWVEFREQGSSTIHTRLSWKSNVTGKMVFVNRYGVKVKSLSVNAFAIELRAERAILIESSSAFDRAINTIVNSIRPYANSPASS